LDKEFVGSRFDKFLRLHCFFRAAAVFVLLVLSPAANAVLTIEIIGTGTNQFPVAIVPFRAEAGLPQPLTPVISADLARSGLFRMVDAGGLNPPPHEPQDLNYGTWRARGAEAVVIGSVAPLPNGRYDVRFRLMDVAKQAQLAGFAYTASGEQLRHTAHRIARVMTSPTRSLILQRLVPSQNLLILFVQHRPLCRMSREGLSEECVGFVDVIHHTFAFA